MDCGDTFLMPAPGGPVTPHLWIVVTQPDPETHLCVIVSVTTLRKQQGSDDHPQGWRSSVHTARFGHLLWRRNDRRCSTAGRRDCSRVGAEARDLLAGDSEAGAGWCSRITLHPDESRALLPGPVAAIAVRGVRASPGAPDRP